MSDKKVWNKNNLQDLNSYRHFPSEMILRAIFSDKYFNNKVKVDNKTKVLDIGCLFVNNLIPFYDRGANIYGTEVTEEGVQIAKDCLVVNKMNGEIHQGINVNLPFTSKFFDIVMSIATLHYEENIKNINKAFKEFSRILKKDGTLILKTVAPNHEMYVNSKKIKKNEFILNYKSDFRHNQKFFFFEDDIELKKTANKYFKNVEIARITESYPNLTLDFYLISCNNS